MSRRAGYAFCSLLELNSKGTITSGIGIGTTAAPTVSYILPTNGITATGLSLT